MKPIILALSAALSLAAQVSYERIRDVAAEPGSDEAIPQPSAEEPAEDASASAPAPEASEE